MLILRLVLAAFLLACAGAASGRERSDCTGDPGALTFIENAPQVRFIIVGETHGTDAYPAYFGDLVCALSSDRSVLVHLELPDVLDDPLRRYLREGDKDALETVRSSWVFTGENYDGRGSAAFLEMIERLREMAAAGRDIRINAFQPGRRTLEPQYYYELAMAHDWTKAAAENRNALNLILVGSYHARRSTETRPQASAASFLKDDDFLALAHCAEGGTASVMMGGEDGQSVSTVMDLRDRKTGLARGIYDRSEFTEDQIGYGIEAFDGYFCIGKPPAASLRAVPPAKARRAKN